MVQSRWLLGLCGALSACGLLGADEGGAERLPNQGIYPYIPLGAEPQDELESDVLDASIEHVEASRSVEPQSAAWLVRPAAEGAWRLSEPSALRDAHRLRLFWELRDLDTERSQIMAAESLDGGLSYGPAEVVLDGTQGPAWLEQSVGAPAVIRAKDGTWQMAFEFGARKGIAVATSEDGWRFSWPVEPSLSAEESDVGGVGSPSLVLLGSSRYLYFDRVADADESTVIALAIDEGTGDFRRIGDVLSPGTDCAEADGTRERCWDASSVSHPEVRVGVTATGKRIFRLWYTGVERKKGALGYAASFDGVSWSRFAFNPIVADGARDYSQPTNVQGDNAYLLYFRDELSPLLHGLALARCLTKAPSVFLP